MEKDRILTHSFTHPAYLMRREAKCLCFGILSSVTTFTSYCTLKYFITITSQIILCKISMKIWEDVSTLAVEFQYTIPSCTIFLKLSSYTFHVACCQHMSALLFFMFDMDLCSLT